MKSYDSVEQWREEGRRRFGEDFEQWKFICPACGHVATVIDFKELGGQPNDAYQNCIGRFNGKGADGMAKHVTPPENGCNWAAYGLFGTCGRGVIVCIGDKSIEAFDFADK